MDPLLACERRHIGQACWELLPFTTECFDRLEGRLVCVHGYRECKEKCKEAPGAAGEIHGDEEASLTVKK
jgi:hypothetical protein